MAAQARAIGGQGLGPALQVAVGARRGQLDVGGRRGVGRQRFVGGRRFGGPAGPAGDEDAVLNGPLAGGRALLPQHDQRGFVFAGARAGDQAVVIIAGAGQGQGGRQGGAGGKQAQACQAGRGIAGR
ncbi:hypothetical protein D9M68_701660 [compost metagenome]